MTVDQPGEDGGMGEVNDLAVRRYFHALSDRPDAVSFNQNYGVFSLLVGFAIDEPATPDGGSRCL
jgi:hypothetical protein